MDRAVGIMGGIHLVVYLLHSNNLLRSNLLKIKECLAPENNAGMVLNTYFQADQGSHLLESCQLVPSAVAVRRGMCVCLPSRFKNKNLCHYLTAMCVKLVYRSPSAASETQCPGCFYKCSYVCTCNSAGLRSQETMHNSYLAFRKRRSCPLRSPPEMRDPPAANALHLGCYTSTCLF